MITEMLNLQLVKINHLQVFDFVFYSPALNVFYFARQLKYQFWKKKLFQKNNNKKTSERCGAVWKKRVIQDRVLAGSTSFSI